MRLKINQEALAALSPKERAQIERDLAQLERIYEEDPLQGFVPNCPEQARFMAARTKTQAAFAGNQSGKTTALVVKALIQVTPRERLPERLRQYKLTPDGPVMGRVVSASAASRLDENVLRPFRQWCPRHMLKDGDFDKSWKTQAQVLTFNDGSFIDFLTYDTDLSKFGTVQRHFIGYDEPPPQDIRDEGLYRLTRYGGFEMFAMTPLKANVGWIKREIWRQREAVDTTVCKWSIHDNKTLSAEAVQAALEKTKNDLWRRAREFGDFVDVGGSIYPQFEDAVVKGVETDWSACFERFKDRAQVDEIVVGIDPGLRNAAFVWIAFDRDNRALVFDELLLQQKYAEDYAKEIRAKNAQWGLRDEQITYVIDPTRRTRALVGRGENVESALNREGIYVVPGENDVESGCGEVGQRLSGGMLEVSPICLGLRDEADIYAMEDREDGVFKEVEGSSFHHCDALRYACVYRTWSPQEELDRPRQKLGYTAYSVPAIDEGDYAAAADMS